MSTLEIRQEIESDFDQIHAVTELAFRGRPYAGGDEQDVIRRLRAGGAMSLSLVALLGEQLVGHVAFSPAHESSGTSPWFALGPVSVLPQFQNQGIGSALIERGLMEIRELGAIGCILTGNPDYYRRFGFDVAVANAPDNEPGEFFMIKPFTDIAPGGRFAFHQAFYTDN
jgi:putative acetyltransferase